MKITNLKAREKLLFLRDTPCARAFQIPGGIYGLPDDATLMRVQWAPSVKSEHTLYDRDTCRYGRGLDQWQMNRYACVNLANGRMYMIGEDIRVQRFDAEVILS